MGEPLRVVSWNCAGAFREKIGRALALDADVYVIQEAEPVDRYAGLLPPGSMTHYVARPEYAKGVLVFARPGYKVEAQLQPLVPGYSHVTPFTITSPSGASADLWAVWTLGASRHEAAYVGQAHLALDDLEPALRTGTVMIGDYNSNAIWDKERRRNHSTLVSRLAVHGLVSAYHLWTGEVQGSESQPTFFLHRREAKPFHLDHCFTDLEVLDVKVGTFADWSGLKAAGGVSDHVPVTVVLALPVPEGAY
ncbi:endonuclease/exonuclease/phosphatase family protein [Nocardioides sp. T2.26MG-1]|uniref:endonuclease/exonuclease/phosphatase family protein n=1 Tax=Nocardioides sp. T2.26MG-1 TaxID=3041166 RepID=UPI002477B35E|nr:endonuclease/exonuclease/phosphatase family protein [Nocardioides sp. T2.26MG-1]CAI9405513.1 hypothetical protein HIDPHFAB_04399 [Nocardioides sp. T2.26MG-1]